MQPIQLGAAMLASEVSNVANFNAIVIGGPCANPIAATLLGNPEPCWESVSVNKAIIKLIEQGNGNVALLVNGREAVDTRRASRALATQTFPAVSEVEVTGTTLTDITVKAIGTPTA